MTSKNKKTVSKKQPRPESPSDKKNQSPSSHTGPRAVPYQKPVAKTSQHPSKRTKVGPEETMDVDSPSESEDVFEDSQTTIPLDTSSQTSALSPPSNPQQNELAPQQTAETNIIGSSPPPTSPNTISQQRAENLITDVDPNAMPIDMENPYTAPGNDQRNDPPNFSLDI